MTRPHDTDEDHERGQTATLYVHLHVHEGESDFTKAALSAAITKLLHRSDLIMSALDTLTANVAANTSGIDSAITLLRGLKVALDEAITALPDTTALQALSDSLATDDAKLAAAVVENTPTPP